jgi:phosphoribosylformylglycinamidine synthase
MSLDFKIAGDQIFLIGESVNDIGCSEYVYSYHKIKNSSAPYFDLETEYKVQQVVKEVIQRKLVQSAHDVSDGGLFIALAESAMHRNLGFSIETDFDCRADAFLFGEAQSRVVVSVNEKNLDQFLDVLAKSDIQWANLGSVTDGEILIDEQSFGHISEAKKMYEHALEKMLN